MPAMKLRIFLLPTLALLCLLLSACRPPPLMSYPWFWDYTRAKPMERTLLGKYKIRKIRLEDDLATPIRGNDPFVTLNADETAAFAGFPYFDGFGHRVDCYLSGTARWSLDKDLGVGSGWQLRFENYQSSSPANKCGPENAIWPILLLGQKPPYRLYLTIGDPDSDTGIEFERVSR